MDLESVLQLSSNKLDVDLKDDLYNYISFMDMNKLNIDKTKMVNLLKITQEVLKYKGEQVDSLISEFDEMARKQGEEEARKIQLLENEIKLLKSESKQKYDSEYEELKFKIKEQKSNIKLLKQELEKLTKENTLLQEENIQLQSEKNNGYQDSDSQSVSDTQAEQNEALMQSLRQKNKQISQLLADIETIEKENVILQENVTSVRNELKSATEELTQTTNALKNMRTIIQEYTEKIDHLKEQNEASKNHIDELVQEKKEKDRKLDHFSLMLDTKIEELKKLLEEKQVEIDSLNLTIAELNKKIPTTRNETLLKLAEKEKQIEELEAKLLQATKEIEKSSALLEQVAKESETRTPLKDETDAVQDLKTQLNEANERCQQLQLQANLAEQDAKSQGQQVSDLITQLRKYESGQYGLQDAIQEIQNYRKQIQIREKQITTLVHNANKLQTMCDKLEQENYILRNKLKISPEVPIVTNGMVSKQHKQKKMISNLQNQIDNLEDEKLQFKVKQHKYKNIIKSLEMQIVKLGAEPDIQDNIDDSINEKNREKIKVDKEIKKKFDEALEENEALRKGMHEILESIKKKNDSGTYDIKCETLEKLLHALDVRHVSGWYAPAMRHAADALTLRGANNELRQQLKQTRLELNSTIDELRLAQKQIMKLQKQIHISRGEPQKLDDKEKASIDQVADGKERDKENANDVTDSSIKEDPVQHSETEQVSEVSGVPEKCTFCKMSLDEKENLVNKYEQAKSNEKLLEKTIEQLQSKFQEYCLNNPELAMNNSSETATKIANDFVILNRKCVFLEENENKFNSENVTLKTELKTLITELAFKSKDYEISKNELTVKLIKLENELQNSVPKQEFESLNKKYYDLTAKYQEILNNERKMMRENFDVSQFKKEIELLINEKNEITDQLYKLKCLNLTSLEVKDVEKKLAQSEIRELSEKQRADHVNSLYELVKDQLSKSEERNREIENQNKMLIASSLKLQLSQQEFHDKLINCVAQEEFDTLQKKYNELRNDIDNFKIKNEQLLNRNKFLENEISKKEIVKSCYNTEFMGLKHLILDLQATSDDKALIARLGTDLVMARLCESDARNKNEILNKEIGDLRETLKEKENKLVEKEEKLKILHKKFENKHKLFYEIVDFLRKQYLGYIPLTSQERFSEILRQAFQDNITAYDNLRTIVKKKNEILVQEEKLNIELNNISETKKLITESNFKKIEEKINLWNNEKNSLQLSEMRLRRNYELKNSQLEEALERIKKQDFQLAALEEEILNANNNILNISSTFTSDVTRTPMKMKKFETKYVATDPCIIESKSSIDKRMTITKETQTSITSPANNNNINGNNKNEEIISILRDDIKKQEKLILLKDNNLQEQSKMISELEKDIEDLKIQLREKENQPILPQTPVEPQTPTIERQQINIIDDIDLEEHNKLKRLVNQLQTTLSQKEESILNYEQLLKEQRVEHSLAAERFQEELRQLSQEKLAPPRNKISSHKLTQVTLDPVPSRAAVETYIARVHELERHAGDLETAVKTLTGQLHASRQEAVRWRTLAQDRLDNIDLLRQQLNDDHATEISAYKQECDKYKSECNSLKQEISKLKLDHTHHDTEILQKIQDRDKRIHDLTIQVTQLQGELKMQIEDIRESETPRITELQMSTKLLKQELDVLKSRYQTALGREKTLREQIRNLKGQLIKRPFLSARNDQRSDREFKDQLQKKVASLEKELSECQQKLEKEQSINEARRAKTLDEFTLWEKQKRYQLTAEKLKEKLTAKCEEFDKMQQNLTSAKSIISRLERERHILEGKLKLSKTASSTNICTSKIETLELENARLQSEIEILVNKLEMRQHHAGELGTTLLEEKLEAQERKIAILEVTAKGSADVTSELERLSSQVALLQKTNLRLEAENLELRLDLEKSAQDTPHLRQQIQHLEKYIEVLKNEKRGEDHHVVTCSGDQGQTHTEQSKRTAELEKTVLSLRRLVERLQQDNKRLQGRPCTETKYGDKSHLDYKKLKDQYGECVQKCARLQDELEKCQKRVKMLEKIDNVRKAGVASERNLEIEAELASVKTQLQQKTQLLDKIKILLQKAASKEKALQDQVTRLKALIPKDGQSEINF